MAHRPHDLARSVAYRRSPARLCLDAVVRSSPGAVGSDRFRSRTTPLDFGFDSGLSLSDECNVAKVKHAAESKLSDIEQRIAELQRIRQGRRTLIAACPGHGRAEACPILNALNQEESR